MERDEIHEKIIQAYNRLAFIYQQDLKLPNPSNFMDTVRKRKTKLQETRGNIDYTIKNKNIDQAMKWITDQFTNIFKNAITDTFSILPSRPCQYAILSLGPFTRSQCTPTSRLQYAILIAVCISLNNDLHFINLSFRIQNFIH